MSCYHPIEAYKTQDGQLKFSDKFGGKPLTLPCGQCWGCKLERSRQWAMRCVHEASLHQDNCFITLTYNDENVPLDGSLVKSHHQLFMKRLRKKYGSKIKFYHCGEYGDKNNRPHYHSILFGFNFKDWVYLFDSPSGQPIYTSPSLKKLWGKGFVTIGTVTFESAAYIARYCMKKLNGPLADQINKETGLKTYERFHSYTGEITTVLPEYSTMSRGGRTGRGIGFNWLSKYTLDCYPKDFTTIRGVRVKPPKYYDQLLREIDPAMYDDIKAGRTLQAFKNSDEGTPSRLHQREIVKRAQTKNLKRSL